MNVVLADDHRLLLEGLNNLLTAHGINVVGLARDGREAVTLAQTLQPDVILMDIRMPNCDGLDATRRIKAEMPDMKIVILTTSAEDHDLFEAIKSGACGYPHKSIDAEELGESLGQAQHGIPPFSAGLATKILHEFAHLAASVPVAPTSTKAEAPERESALRLTTRQREILTLVAQGLAYKEVGARLDLSARTIKYHMAEIMQQLHLEHRAQVLAYAGRIGLSSDCPPDE
jgi:DNA-binding NarL/FixJ family response regulator